MTLARPTASINQEGSATLQSAREDAVRKLKFCNIYATFM
jgi:hypothetical protein